MNALLAEVHKYPSEVMQRNDNQKNGYIIYKVTFSDRPKKVHIFWDKELGSQGVIINEY
jgi:hypothetical protein